MNLSTSLPPYYQSWNEFHDDVLRADLPADQSEIYWYHALENKGIITRGCLRDHDQLQFSVRHIEQQALAELKVKQQTFDLDELRYLHLYFNAAECMLFHSEPSKFFVALQNKISELFYRARLKNREDNRHTNRHLG